MQVIQSEVFHCMVESFTILLEILQKQVKVECICLQAEDLYLIVQLGNWTCHLPLRALVVVDVVYAIPFSMFRKNFKKITKTYLH